MGGNFCQIMSIENRLLKRFINEADFLCTIIKQNPSLEKKTSPNLTNTFVTQD